VSWGVELTEGYIFGWQDGCEAARKVTIEELTTTDALWRLAAQIETISYLDFQAIGVRPAAKEALERWLEEVLSLSLPDRGRGRPRDVLAYFDGVEAGKASVDPPEWMTVPR
jgi:hypothetical protein